VEETEQPLRDDYVYAVNDEAAYLQADDEKPPIPKEPFPSILCQFCGKTFEQPPIPKPGSTGIYWS